jgi:hypothetical protein
MELLNRAAGPYGIPQVHSVFLLTDAWEAGKKKFAVFAAKLLRGRSQPNPNLAALLLAPALHRLPRGQAGDMNGRSRRMVALALKRQARSHGDRRLEAESRRNAETTSGFSSLVRSARSHASSARDWG